MSGWATDGATVRDVGEFGLIDRLRDALPPSTRTSAAVRLGIGDDCAVWTPTAGESAVVTTDSLVEGIHFRRDWSDPDVLGHKMLAVNLSDLASMGAVPRLAVVTLALRGDERVDDLRRLYRGMGALAERTGTAIVGGDIVRSPDSFAIHVTALGETRGGRFLTRAGARRGDLVGVSGTLGAAAAGLGLLMDDTHPGRRVATAARLIEAHRRPEPRLDLGGILLGQGASAAMDLSDGLLGDLPKILAASGVSARIDARRLPVAAAVRALFPSDWLDLATRGGEDYELLFTAAPDVFARIEAAAGTGGATVTAIGEILAAGDEPAMTLVGLDGREEAVRPGAFDHFAG